MIKVVCYLMLVLYIIVPEVLSQTLDKHFLNSTVFIEYQPDVDHVSSGTGFVLFDPYKYDNILDRTSSHMFIVTNKHVLPPENSAREIRIRFAIRDEANHLSPTAITVRVLDDEGKYLSKVVLHPDPAVDVAVISLGPQTPEMQNSELIRSIAKTNDLLTTHLLVRRVQQKEAQIGTGTEVYTLGFPGGIYGKDNVSPMLRLGLIATAPDADLTFSESVVSHYKIPARIRGFLIDSSVFPGSSGSLVFRRTGFIPGIETGGPPSIPYILGIISMSVPIQDLWGYERMGVGVVYDSETICETIALADQRLYPDEPGVCNSH